MVQTFRKVYKSEYLTRKKDISNAFKTFFAENFNDVLQLVSKAAFSKKVKLLENLNSLNELLILKAIQKTKCWSAITSDNFPRKVNSLSLPTIILQSFSDHFNMLNFFLSGRTHIIFRCSSQKSKLILPTLRLWGFLPKVSLVFERLLLTFFYEKVRNHIFQNQFRVQSRKSAVVQFLDFIETIKLGKVEQQCTLKLDYAIGFDNVPLNVLLSKRSRIGLDDELLELLSSYVNDRHQFVNFCRYLSNTIPVRSGVPQGFDWVCCYFQCSSTVYRPYCSTLYPSFLADDLKLLLRLSNL